ncbi:MAG: hypothetical protein ABI780_06470 [Ardenticatenales bacterium]
MTPRSECLATVRGEVAVEHPAMHRRAIERLLDEVTTYVAAASEAAGPCA